MSFSFGTGSNTFQTAGTSSSTPSSSTPSSAPSTSSAASSAQPATTFSFGRSTAPSTTTTTTTAAAPSVPASTTFSFGHSRGTSPFSFGARPSPATTAAAYTPAFGLPQGASNFSLSSASQHIPSFAFPQPATGGNPFGNGTSLFNTTTGGFGGGNPSSLFGNHTYNGGNGGGLFSPTTTGGFGGGNPSSLFGNPTATGGNGGLFNPNAAPRGGFGGGNPDTDESQIQSHKEVISDKKSFEELRFEQSGQANKSFPPFQIHQELDKLSTDMLSMIDNPDLSDVTLIVEGKRILCHKGILAARCDKFKAMFLGGMRESKEAEIELKEIRYDSFMHLLKYCYAGLLPTCEKEDNLDWLVDLMGLADEFLLPTLAESCGNLLIPFISSTTVVTLLSTADQHHLKSLKNSCMYFCMRNFAELSKTLSDELDKDILFELLSFSCNQPKFG